MNAAAVSGVRTEQLSPGGAPRSDSLCWALRGSPGEGTWPWTRAGAHRRCIPSLVEPVPARGARAPLPARFLRCLAPDAAPWAWGWSALRVSGLPRGSAPWPRGLRITSLQGGFRQSPCALSYSSAVLAGSGRLSHSLPSLLVPPAQPHSARSPGRGLRERDRGWAAGTCAGECLGGRLCSPWQSLRSVNLVVTRSQSQHTHLPVCVRASRAFPVEFSRNVASKGFELLKIKSQSSPEKYGTRGPSAGLLKRARPRQVGIPGEGLDAQWSMPNCHI